MHPIKNRESAGELLVEKLKDRDFSKSTVLALPRGGVPVAREIANAFKLPLDILLVKKIGLPEQPEYAIGAVSEDEHPIWNLDAISLLGLKKQKLRDLAEMSHKKILEQTTKWRKGRKALGVKGKEILVVDDGLATGLTMLSAVEFLKRRGAAKIIVVVPVASQTAVSAVKDQVDEVICLQTPEPFFSVGQWYEDFSQVSDETVTEILSGQTQSGTRVSSVKIRAQEISLAGELAIPLDAKGTVIFAHGSGSGHMSPRNQQVASALNQMGFATLLFDLLSPEEAEVRANVFNVPLLAERLTLATKWIRNNEPLKNLPVGYFGASTGAAAALVAAANDKTISSVVSRGGRPDMAGESLPQVHCPVLLIVGGADVGVVELNKAAHKKLNHAEVVIVPKAGHLFGEPGALDEVMELAGDWFTKTLTKNTVPLKIEPRELVIQEILNSALAIESEESFEPLLKKLTQSKVVMLGEATHGTEEFYKFRRIISQKLIENYGFKFIAVEGDWPDCYKLNEYAQLKGPGSAKNVMKEFKRWPTWMWANQQTADLMEWMRGRGVGFYGLDVYSLYESLDVVKAYARRLDPKLETQILEAYSCLEFFDRDEIEYAKSLVKWPSECETEILKNLREILRLRMDDTPFREHELFDMQQNAKIIRDAEQYYRAMIMGGAESWNIRDEHMMDTLDSLLRFYGDGAKGIVWAHNTHIGDYHATDMVREGYVNLGGLARERYGMKSVSLVGFGTYGGQVLAGRAWDAKAEVMQLPSAVSGSYEDYFHRAAEQKKNKDFYLMMDGKKALSSRKGHRAVGVVYQPSYEAHGRNYVPTELSQRYDAFVFVDKTSALKSFPGKGEKGVFPEFWPVGT